MSATGLIVIKRRIKSIKNTRKITKALGLVATSKLKKARQRLSANNYYFKECEEVYNEVLKSYEDENIYTVKNNSSKKLYIVLTSDMGLCGSFNGSIVNYVIDEIENDIENSLVLVVGARGKTLFNRYKIDTVAEYVDVGDIPTVKESSAIYNHAFDLYRKGEVSEVHIVYTEFISQLKKHVKMEKILPINMEDFDHSNETLEFNTNSETLTENVINLYLNGKVLNSMLHSKVCEQSYRMEAMDGATRNSDTLLDELNLKYNRIRQSAITQELSEIVGGAQAQE
ncbi:ATP synthase F1 subunit gamma [Clostridium sp. Marseille-QA1073]